MRKTHESIVSGTERRKGTGKGEKILKEIWNIESIRINMKKGGGGSSMKKSECQPDHGYRRLRLWASTACNELPAQPNFGNPRWNLSIRQKNIN